MEEKKGFSIEFIRSKCTKCTKCVQKCHLIGIDHLEVKGQGKDRYLDFLEENPCINCGQCTLVCPFNCMIEQKNVKEVKELLKDKNKIKIVQCAPSVRTSINEIFKLEHSPTMEKKINTALRMLGFDKIFDVNFGADITSYVEANELLERIEHNEHLPMFTSCCPSWVNFVAKYKPELTKNLTTAMSPHIHSGMAYKTWWAEENHIDPKNIVVVSIMPCTSKKDEIKIYNKYNPVDYSITVREFGQLIKDAGIDFASLEESEADNLAKYSGGAVIYGKSGGVMESALRVLKKKLENKVLPKLEFKEVKDDDYFFKEAEIELNGKKLKVAVIHTPKNIKKFIETGKYKEYTYIEVMNCNGGCINGGGQPLLPPKPGSEEDLIEKRRSVLNSLDNTTEIKCALDNSNLIDYINWAKDKNFKNDLFYRTF